MILLALLEVGPPAVEFFVLLRCDLKPFLGLLAVDVLGFTLVSSESLNFSQDTSKIYKYSNKFYFILHHHLLLWYFFCL